MLVEMGILKANRSRAVAALILFILVAVLGIGLRNASNPLSDELAQNSYDCLHIFNSWQQDPPTNSPVVIIYLDLPSYLHERKDPTQPWPRQLHAQLLRRLKAAGARAVMFDIVFGAAGPDPASDTAFAEAIHDQGNVILAAEFNNSASHSTTADQPWTRTTTLLPPFGPFASAAARWGIASQEIDDDLVVRRYLAGFTAEQQPTLTWAAARWLQLPITQTSAAMQTANGRWVRYYGPPLTIAHVSYSEALDPEGVPDSFFRGRIVFVGARPMAELFRGRQDEFRSPYHSWRNKELFMPGVEVHATEMLNLVRGDWLRRLAPSAENGLLLLCALLFGGGLIWLRPVPATLVALAGAGVTLMLSLNGFSRGIWFPWLMVTDVQIPMALGGSILFNSLEWYRARRRFEAAKREAEAIIREQAALIDKAHDAILVQHIDGRILHANPSAERLYGWKLVDLQRNGAAAELFSADAAGAAAARQAALTQGEWNGELRHQTRTGQVVIVASRWTLIRDDAGQPKALLLINSDITDQKQLESQLLRTQRMNTIGTLAGGMAHDLNNALAPILMGVQLLRRKTKDEESNHLLGWMETSTHRGADMVRQVLLFARGRGGEFERLELGALVRELEKMVRETFPKNIVVKAFLPDDLWPVRGNPTQLHQVLLNLTVNARDAMPDGGRLSLVADNVELTDAEAAAIPGGKPGNYVSLLVSDTGTGMPPEVLAKIFEPFFTTKGEGRGTGIGLSTVARIVKSHDGFLRAESEPGQGTAFEIFLPAVIEAARAEVIKQPVEIPGGQGELVLVADDEQAIRELVGDALTSCGYKVLTAGDGQEVLRLYAQHQAEVRLLIIDRDMPVLDGPDTIAALRKQPSNLPIVLASDEGIIDTLTHANVIRLSKPFSLDELLTVVSQSLSKK